MSAATSVEIEQFHCPATGVTQARTSCAARHKRSSAEASGKSAKGKEHLTGAEACVRCEVGKAHAAGEAPTHWPDGQLIELTTKRIPLVSARRAPSPRSEERTDQQHPSRSTHTPIINPGRCAPRAAEPTKSPKAKACSEAKEKAERAAGGPGAGPGARAAEQSVAERPASVRSESAAAGGAGRAPKSATKCALSDGPAQVRGRSSESNGFRPVASSSPALTGRDRDPMKRVNTGEGRDSSPPGTNHPFVARAEASAEAGPTSWRGQESPEGAPESGAARERGRGERAPNTEGGNRRRKPYTPPQPPQQTRFCVDCGDEYQPTGQRQKRCPPCGAGADRARRAVYDAQRKAATEAARTRAPRIRMAIYVDDELVHQVALKPEHVMPRLLLDGAMKEQG